MAFGGKITLHGLNTRWYVKMFRQQASNNWRRFLITHWCILLVAISLPFELHAIHYLENKSQLIFNSAWAGSCSCFTSWTAFALKGNPASHDVGVRASGLLVLHQARECMCVCHLLEWIIRSRTQQSWLLSAKLRRRTCRQSQSTLVAFWLSQRRPQHTRPRAQPAAGLLPSGKREREPFKLLHVSQFHHIQLSVVLPRSKKK